MMNSAAAWLGGHPCLGSWVNYGLGSVNEDLPGFVVMLDKTGGPISGAQELVDAATCRPAFQGTVLPRPTPRRSTTSTCRPA